MKLKIGDANAPKEPELSLFLKQDNKQQIILQGRHSEVELPVNNCLAWVTESGEFIINADAVKRVGLRITYYNRCKE